MTKTSKLLKLFFEFFKISLFVVGGGHAILVVADDIFSRKLKWLKEGELISRLPIFQMVPGLVAGNTAIYVGLKIAGRLGAALSLLAVTLPSFIIFLFVSMGFNYLPLENPIIESAFLGLRSSLTGILFATIIKGWAKNIKGIYGYSALIISSALLIIFKINTVYILLLAMITGIVLEFTGISKSKDTENSIGVYLPPLSKKVKLIAITLSTAAIASITVAYKYLVWIFIKFGLLCFGGGFVLIPVYESEFVGPDAPFLQLHKEEFANIIALTQMTPGPVSINAATFFGYRLSDIAGATIATAGLLAPSFILLTIVLTGLNKWQNNRIVKGLLNGVKPATIALMLSALVTFAKMSIISDSSVDLFGLLLAILATIILLKQKLSVMAIIFISALISVVVSVI